MLDITEDGQLHGTQQQHKPEGLTRTQLYTKNAAETPICCCCSRQPGARRYTADSLIPLQVHPSLMAMLQLRQVHCLVKALT